MSPDSTTDPGSFTAATARTASCPAMTRAASSGGIATQAIFPRPVAFCMIRLRHATSLTAVSSDSAPATCAAATSPTLCPRTPSGVMPHEPRSAVRPIWIAKRAGCTTSVSPSRERSSGARSSSSNDQETCRRRSSSHSSSLARNTGSSARSRWPIPTHWDP